MYIPTFCSGEILGQEQSLVLPVGVSRNGSLIHVVTTLDRGFQEEWSTLPLCWKLGHNTDSDCECK